MRIRQLTISELMEVGFPRIWNLRRPQEIPNDAVRVDRRSPWGNPFRMRNGSDQERNRVCDAFEEWVMSSEQELYRKEVRRVLRGKNLTCWCSPLRCHAETLLRIANRKEAAP